MQNTAGNLEVESTSNIQINGNLTVITDTVRFEDASSGVIAGDMTLQNTAVFYRNPGTLLVLGILLNNGFLFNLGLIEIGTP